MDYAFFSKFTIFKQISFESSDRAAYSDLNPVDGGQSLYPMGTVSCFNVFDGNSKKTVLLNLVLDFVKLFRTLFFND